MIKKVVSRQSSVVGITLLLLFTTYNLQLTTCFAQSISSTELINNTKKYDGKTVIYQGEVIGDVMLRQNYAWVNVNDGQNAIGIWVDKNLANNIFYTGSYKSKGDWVEITGTFARACLEHGGDLDIHASALKKISSGRRIKDKLNTVKIRLIFILLVTLGLVWILKSLKHK